MFLARVTEGISDLDVHGQFGDTLVQAVYAIQDWLESHISG